MESEALPYVFLTLDVPIMMVLSLLKLFWWIGSVLLNYLYNPAQSWMIALGLGSGDLVGSVIIVKLITEPLRPLF